MYGIIYITTNNINGKKYIGQHRCSTRDFDGYYGSGTLLKDAIRIYGQQNFTRQTLDIANSQEELNDLQTTYIALFDAVNSPQFYNISKGGQYYMDEMSSRYGVSVD